MNAPLDPLVHLQFHRDRVEVGFDAAHHDVPQRPRPPGRVRREAADRLRAVADRLDHAAIRARQA